MIKLLLFFIGLSLLMFFGSAWVGEKGYVLIALGETTIETSVVAGLFILLSAYVALHIMVILIKTLWQIRAAGSRWRTTRQQKSSFKQFETALEALFSKEYALAEKLSSQSADTSPMRKSHYLLAAEAARAQGKHELQTQYSLRAVAKGSETEKQLVLAQSLKDEGELNKAIERTEAILAKNPNQSQALVLLAMLYRDAANWSALADLLVRVKKHCQLEPEIFESMLADAYNGLYSAASRSKDVKRLNKLNSAMHKLSEQPDKLSHLYVNALVDAGFHSEAEKYLLKVVKAELNDDLLLTLQKARLQQPNKLIAWLEQAIKNAPDNIQLISALGYVAVAAGEWHLAQRALETSLRHQTNAQDYYRLAKVLEKLEQPKSALSCYRRGVELAANS